MFGEKFDSEASKLVKYFEMSFLKIREGKPFC